ncbi:matrixin [Halegenticoccus tardaugens]|uniref:matrixin n=1 Tax=Halegenticoccus tardaugens TaxID=2071624 RepID=UPI00100ABD3D|nr:matrixin [Halegenticoccus tardaugens]
MNARTALVPVFLALLVVLTGCVAPIPVDDAPFPGSDSAEPTPPSPSDGESVSGETPSGDATPTPVEPRPSPWGEDPIVVGIETPAGSDRDFVPVVREATDYWEQRAERYAGYPVTYRIDPDAENPDVAVRFVENVDQCGNTTEAAGCAPLITDERQIPPSEPVPVYVKTGLSDASTVHVVKHELGHTIGLSHDDEPREVMQSHSVLYTESQVDAVDRAFPWLDADFPVYVDDAGARDPEGAREQVGHALGYYERGADGSVPENLTFRTVGSAAEADVVVRFSDTSPCGPGVASCFATTGPDPDGDGAIEYYTQLRIVIVDTETDAIGWHVGNWIAYSLGAEEEAERPEPFRDADYEERRSQWWR